MYHTILIVLLGQRSLAYFFLLPHTFHHTSKVRNETTIEEF